MNWLIPGALAASFTILAAFAANRYWIKTLDSDRRTLFLLCSPIFAFVLFILFALVYAPREGGITIYFENIKGGAIYGVAVCLPAFILGVIMTSLTRIKLGKPPITPTPKANGTEAMPHTDNTTSSPRNAG